MKLIQADDPALLVVEGAQRLRREGLTVSSLGNVSVRDQDDVWITPTRVLASFLEPHDIVILPLNGEPRSGGTPSGETPLHLAIYRADPTIRAVVHTHSPWATAWSYRAQDLDLETEELRYHRLPRIPCTEWRPAGSSELADEGCSAVAEAGVALLAGHGVVAAGPSLPVAIERAALAEHQAHLQWLVRIDETGGRPSRKRML